MSLFLVFMVTIVKMLGLVAMAARHNLPNSVKNIHFDVICVPYQGCVPGVCTRDVSQGCVPGCVPWVCTRVVYQENVPIWHKCLPGVFTK